MPSADQRSLSCEILDERVTLYAADLCRMFGVEESRIREWVEEGVLSTLTIDATELRFGAQAVRRTRIALRLERDLGINLPGVALALDLLEELEQLRRGRGAERP